MQRRNNYVRRSRNTSSRAGTTLADIQAVVQIIDICSKRGAFEGAELESIGGLRGRVVGFLEANLPKEGEEAAAPDAAPVVEEEASDDS